MLIELLQKTIRLILEDLSLVLMALEKSKLDLCLQILRRRKVENANARIQLASGSMDKMVRSPIATRTH